VLVGQPGCSLRCAGSHRAGDVQRALAELRSRGAEGIEPEADEEAVRGLKFSDCLPAPLAGQTLRSRLTDREGVRAVLEQAKRFVVG
jgi:ATP-dependent Lhr-like helicase